MKTSRFGGTLLFDGNQTLEIYDDLCYNWRRFGTIAQLESLQRNDSASVLTSPC